MRHNKEVSAHLSKEIVDNHLSSFESVVRQQVLDKRSNQRVRLASRTDDRTIKSVKYFPGVLLLLREMKEKKMTNGIPQRDAICPWFSNKDFKAEPLEN